MPSRHIIDFHTHAFPESIAAYAVPKIAEQAGVAPALDGTIPSLLASMDAAGIERSVVCSIATKPQQFQSILQWSLDVSSDRIIPLASLHPDDPHSTTRVQQIAAAGLRGIKLHPYYQDFILDDEALFPVYDAARRAGLIVVSHTGFDIAFPRDDRASPERVLRIIEAFPGLKFVATHLGGWEDWDRVERHLLGKPIATEISFAEGYLPRERLRRFLLRHPPESLLFGSDSPWRSQSEALNKLSELDLPEKISEHILSHNALQLLQLQPYHD